MDYNLKKNPDKSRGDTIEIRLRDVNLNTYFRETAHISDKKQMSRLLEDLKEKGVHFPKLWFE